MLVLYTNCDGQHVEIIGDRQGLQELREALDTLLKSNEEWPDQHYFTDSWGGAGEGDLDEVLEEGLTLVHQLDIRRAPDV